MDDRQSRASLHLCLAWMVHCTGWTGTSREPNYFNGLAKERVFETAFLEYGSMESMTEPTGRKMFFSYRPIEDWPRDWADYKKITRQRLRTTSLSHDCRL